MSVVLSILPVLPPEAHPKHQPIPGSVGNIEDVLRGRLEMDDHHVKLIHGNAKRITSMKNTRQSLPIRVDDFRPEDVIDCPGNVECKFTIISVLLEKGGQAITG